MIQYPIAISISILTLYAGKYLAKISKEEIKDFHEKFKFSLPIFVAVTLFIMMFLLGINIYMSLAISLITIFFTDIRISTVAYFIATIFLAYKFNDFLAASTIIHGLIISSVKYNN